MTDCHDVRLVPKRNLDDRNFFSLVFVMLMSSFKLFLSSDEALLSSSV